MKPARTVSATIALSVAAALAAIGPASAAPISFPTLSHELQLKKDAAAAGVDFIQPPCPENGIVNSVVGSSGVPGVGVGNCGVVQPPATGLPWPGPMAYAGGGVQVHPREYVIFWGWGAEGAFPGKTCVPVKITEPLRDGTTTSFTLPCDPDGAGKLMADFVAQMGGTQWAGSQTQYYQTNPDNTKSYIQNDKNVLAGVWIDNGAVASGDDPNLKSTNSNNPVGLTNTNTALAAEASRAADHFGVPSQDYIQSNFIIVQPAGYSDPNAQALGYCAFHDYTESDAAGNAYYKDSHVKQGILGKSPGIAYTNMPYVLNQGSGCGANSVNSASDGGQLDGFTIALGHEIEETITDPGAEATVGNVSNLSPATASGGGATFFGAWYDATDPNENGDKCAYVGNLTSPVAPIPGQTGDIVGNANERFAVQSLWSNSAAGGAGYCAGVASTDLPGSVGSGEQSGTQGGTAYPENAQTIHPGVQSNSAPTCNAAHLFTDSAADAKSQLSPDPSSGSTGGSQQDTLDITQGDLAFGQGNLTATMTVKDLAAQASSPAKVNRYIVSWSRGSTGYGAEVYIDGMGAVRAVAGTAANKYADYTLTPTAVKVTPGKNGTIVVSIPVADIGNPKAGDLLSAVSMETVEAVNGQVASLGYVVDQDTTTTPFLVGAPICGSLTPAAQSGTSGASGTTTPGSTGSSGSTVSSGATSGSSSAGNTSSTGGSDRSGAAATPKTESRTSTKPKTKAHSKPKSNTKGKHRKSAHNKSAGKKLKHHKVKHHKSKRTSAKGRRKAAR